MNIHNPVTFSEKINWLKVYYHDPLWTIMADKYKGRFYVEKVLGGGYSVPLIGKWNTVDEIDFSILPDKFVLKTNHDGGPIICTDKKSFDFETAKEKLRQKLKQSKYKPGREWAYKNIKRCVIAEEYIGNEVEELIDYKFFCFFGTPQLCYVTSEHTDCKHGALDYFDMQWNHLSLKLKGYSSATKCPRKPEHFNEMKIIAQRISSWCKIPFVRVDMYSTNEKIYVGEMTFYPTNGMVDFQPSEWNYQIGTMLELPSKNGWRNDKERDNEWIQNILML